VLKKSTRQRASCKETLGRVSKIKHSAKRFFDEYFLLPSFFCVSLGKELLCRVLEKKQLAKYLTLGKELNSGSAHNLMRHNGNDLLLCQN
jgi:hypothetical protein